MNTFEEKLKANVRESNANLVVILQMINHTRKHLHHTALLFEYHHKDIHSLIGDLSEVEDMISELKERIENLL